MFVVVKYSVVRTLESSLRVKYVNTAFVTVHFQNVSNTVTTYIMPYSNNDSSPLMDDTDNTSSTTQCTQISKFISLLMSTAVQSQQSFSADVTVV